MLHALLLAALAAPPKLIVVQGSNLGVDAFRVQELVESVAELARLDGFDATVSNRICPDHACLLEVAREAQADAVVSASFATVGQDAVMDLTGTDAATGNTIAQLNFTVRAATHADLVMEPIRFLRTVKVALLEPPELPPTPKEPEAPVCPPPPAPVIVEKPPPEPHPLARLPFVTGAFGVAALVSGGVLLAVNASEAASLSQAIDHGLVPYNRVDQAVAIDDRNSAALGLFITAAATFTLTAILAWLVRS